MKTISETQLNALKTFCQSGGSGYGDFSYCRTSTVKALAKAGLVRLGWSLSCTGFSSHPVAVASQAGVDYLNAREAERAVRIAKLLGESLSLPCTSQYALPKDPYNFNPAPEGWLPGRKPVE